MAKPFLVPPRRIHDITDSELDRLNHLRDRAGLRPLEKPDALKLLNALDGEALAETLQRIKD